MSQPSRREDDRNGGLFADEALRDDAVRDIVLLTMQRLRAPLIVLLIVYFVSSCVMVLVPGQDLQVPVQCDRALERRGGPTLAGCRLLRGQASWTISSRRYWSAAASPAA